LIESPESSQNEDDVKKRGRCYSGVKDLSDHAQQAACAEYSEAVSSEKRRHREDRGFLELCGHAGAIYRIGEGKKVDVEYGAVMWVQLTDWPAAK